MESAHVGLVLSVGFVVMLGQGRRSRSRDTDAQSARAALRLSSVDMRVLVVCVPHYSEMSLTGSRSSFVQGTTFRNVRLNADQSLYATVYLRRRMFPSGTVQLMPGLMTISVWSAVVCCMSNYV